MLGFTRGVAEEGEGSTGKKMEGSRTSSSGGDGTRRRGDAAVLRRAIAGEGEREGEGKRVGYVSHLKAELRLWFFVE